MGKLFAVIALCLCAWAVLAGPQEDRAAAHRAFWDAVLTVGPQDYAEAVKGYRKAADQGDAEAQLNLGVSYASGQGVPQDYVEAHKWSNLSAASATDKEIRDTATHNRDFIASKMTADQVAEAQKLAREWKPTPPVK